MQTDIDLIEREIPRTARRMCIAGTNAAVAVTENQCVIAEPRPCETHSELHRYPLTALTGIRCLRDAHGGLLALEFDRCCTHIVLFSEEAALTTEALLQLVRCPVKKVLRCGCHLPAATITEAA
jgi:hypothetical protein